MRTHGTLVLECTQTGELRTVEVFGVTPRCPNPSLDLRWSVSGVYVLRLYSNQLLVIPKDRVRGRDPAPWRAQDHARAWRIWWMLVPKLSAKEKQQRCPQEFWLPDAEGCSARSGKKACKFSPLSELCVQCGKPRRPVNEESEVPPC